MFRGVWGVFLFCWLVPFVRGDSARKPNVIVILSDDQGWGDLSLNGNTNLKTPHTLCIPFVFGTVDVAAGITGTAPERYALSEKVMDAWIAFARSGNPHHARLPAWPAYSADERATMVFDNECRTVNDPAGADRVAINTAPAYVAELAGRR